MPLKMKFFLPAAIVAAIVASMYFFSTKSTVYSQVRAHCGDSSGRVLVKRMKSDLPSNWCWVSTVSEVLMWHGLPQSSPCELYDLVYGKVNGKKTTCEDSRSRQLKCENASRSLETCWKTKRGNNEPGKPETAANRYRKEYGTITVERRMKAMSFEEIQKKICPSDSSEGNPFVYAFDNGGNFLHDVVVVGYAQLGGSKFVEVHDPGNTLNPDTIDYDLYADEQIWKEEVIISKLR